MTFFPTDQQAFGNPSAEGPVVRLISHGPRLDVGGSVRERLYGDAQRGIEAAAPRGHFCRAALGSWFPRTTGLRVE